MKKLLYKEMKLSANPLSYWFIAFSAMTMIPRYPILVGSFFICLGIFYTYQQIREYDDITYTVMLPVKKKDVVTAKYLFVLFIEFISFILCALITIIRMSSLGNAAPYVTNPLMNANAAYLGYVMIVFAVFNSIFLAGFFKGFLPNRHKRFFGNDFFRQRLCHRIIQIIGIKNPRQKPPAFPLQPPENRDSAPPAGKHEDIRLPGRLR